LQDAGYTGSIIGMTADDMDSDLAQATAQKLGCNALLTKPLDVPRLYQTTEQLLLFTGGAGALTSSLAQNEQMRPLVEKFVQQAHKMAPTLQQALTSKDLSQLREMCRQIKGSGPSFGFQTVAMAAQSALNTLDEANNDLVAMSRAVRELVQMLQRTSVE
jgi:HPt (histidine-containing phosphotransfer) domain-containing protein